MVNLFLKIKRNIELILSNRTINSFTLPIVKKWESGINYAKLISSIGNIRLNGTALLGRIANLSANLPPLNLSSIIERGIVAWLTTNIPQISVNSTAGMNALLRDEFYTDRAAGQVNGTPAEPGIGTRMVTDTEGKAYITNGKLYLTPKTTPSIGDPALRLPAIQRSSGRAMLVNATRLSGILEYVWFFGFDNNLTSIPRFYFYPYKTDLFLRSSENLAASHLFLSPDFPLNINYKFALVLRSAGAYWLVKGGALSRWTLLYVDSFNTDTTLYPSLVGYQAIVEIEYCRIVDLPAPFNDDFGFATQRLAGARNTGDTFSHEANCLIEWVVTTLPSSGSIQMAFRKQDDNNYWQVVINPDGSLALQEVVNGVPITRGTAAAGSIANGQRMVVVTDDINILVHANYLEKFFYKLANNFKTQTSGKLLSLGTGGAVSDIISWKRYLTTEESAILDRYSAG